MPELYEDEVIARFASAISALTIVLVARPIV